MALDAEILLAHSAWLARLARALVVKDDEIDDVVQQTFAQALAKPPSHTTNIRAWLATIAKNVVRSRRRSDSARVAREIAVEPRRPIEDPAEALERAEMRELVVKTVLGLDEPYRSALILRFFEEMDVEAISRMTKSGQDTVRTRIRRGVIRVRELLERHVRDEARDSADGGAAAVAALFRRLHAIGDGHRPTPVAPGRGPTARGARPVSTVVAPRVLAGAAIAVFAGGAAIWWKATHHPPAASKSVAENHRQPLEGNAQPGPLATAEPVPATRESARVDTVPPTPNSTTANRPATRGTIRGIVRAPDGTPVARAFVWAIRCPSFKLESRMPEFGPVARREANPDVTTHQVAGWMPTRSDEAGNYSFNDISSTSGWQIGAFEATVGANVTDVVSMHHDHPSLDVGLTLVRGSVIRGSVRDEDGAPVGDARVFLFTKVGSDSSRTATDSDPLPPHIGEFNFDFHCGDSILIGCGTPTFISTDRVPVEIAPKTTETVIPIVLKRRPGIRVSGKIVDPTGARVDLAELLSSRFASDRDDMRWSRAAVWAVAPGSVAPHVLMAGMPPPKGFIEGWIDFAESRYEAVVPEGFVGTLELRIFKSVVGTADLADPHHPPDLECDEERLPREGDLVRFAVQFVSAETKEPIDLSKQEVLPPLVDADRSAPVFRSDSDPAHGLVVYHCMPGQLWIEPAVRGFAVGRVMVDVPSRPQQRPLAIELVPARAGVRGVAYHFDGRPFPRAEIHVFRRDSERWVDASGPRTVTNDDGAFEFDQLAIGEHVVVVSGQPEESPGVSSFLASISPPDVDVRTSAGRSVRFRILGKQRDRATPPNPEFRIFDRNGVLLEDLKSHWSEVSKSPEEATLRLDDGHYTVLVTRYGFREARIEFDVPRESLDVPLEWVDSEAK